MTVTPRQHPTEVQHKVMFASADVGGRVEVRRMGGGLAARSLRERLAIACAVAAR
jgi:xanthine dehydrogenase molybdopterin-binding subunit B